MCGINRFQTSRSREHSWQEGVREITSGSFDHREAGVGLWHQKRNGDIDTEGETDTDTEGETDRETHTQRGRA